MTLSQKGKICATRAVKNAKYTKDTGSSHSPPPKETVSDPLFNGTLHFVQITFNTPGGPFSMNNNDIKIALQYSNHAITPISEYASQYGTNSIAVSEDIIEYSILSCRVGARLILMLQIICCNTSAPIDNFAYFLLNLIRSV